MATARKSRKRVATAVRLTTTLLPDVGDQSFPDLAGTKELRKKAATRYYSVKKGLGNGGRTFMQRRTKRELSNRIVEEPTLNGQDGKWSSKPPSKQRQGPNPPPHFGIQRSSFPLTTEMKMRLQPQMIAWKE